MSYCRSGPDSDVYVYGIRDSIIMHVAYNRGQAGNVPLPHTGATEAEFDRYFADLLPLDHPLVGTTHHFEQYSDAISFLEAARDSGLRVPQRAIDRLLAEQHTQGDTYA